MLETPAARLARQMSVNRTKWNAENYAARYHEHLQPIKDEPIRLLEIGIGGYDDPHAGGDSLRAWKDYFPNGTIYGIDIVDKKALEEDRIHTFCGDQADPEFLRAVVAETGPLDIIIDDGSHRSRDVIQSFRILFPHLKQDGGVYAVEDMHFSYIPSIATSSQGQAKETPSWGCYGGSLTPNGIGSAMQFFKRLADCLNYEEFFNPGYQPNEFDLNIRSVHFYRNQVFVLKGANRSGGNLMRNNTLRPEWLALIGLTSVDDLGIKFPVIDDPTR
jgi:hypothetical protein